MRSKPVIARQTANRDVDEAIDHYLQEATETVALGLVDALQQAYRHIGRHPVTGSPRYGLDLDLPGLRHWRLTHYPYLVFYIEREDHVDVWRVLHEQRDIPAWMRESTLD